MYRPFLTLAFILFFSSFALAVSESRFMTDPDIHGDKLVFTFEEDLWIAGTQGGAAARITSHPGREHSPKFSPDGRWIAFSGSYDGGTHVYYIPAEGGSPERLTFCGSAQVIGWMPGGERIIFRSAMDYNFRPIAKLYSVSMEGDQPQQLPVPAGVLCSFSPDGRKMVYNRRGREEYYWKRYKGGQYQDIWLADLETGEFTPLTKYVGKNSYPMWIGERMFFVCDQGESGIANFYTYEFASGKITQVTRYSDFDVQMPSTDGRQIVYLHGGNLHILDAQTLQSRKVSVSTPSDRWKIADRTVNPKDCIHSMSITDDGESAVFEARGDIFLVPTDSKKETQNLTKTPGSRERYPQVSPDGKKVAFFSDRSGEYELYLLDLEKGGEWIRITNGQNRTVYHLLWSPDSRKILFGNKDFSIFYVDVETKTLTRVDSSNQLKNDEFYWEVSDYQWSPDSKWIVYSFVQYNRNNRIFLYSLEEKKGYALTGDFYDCLNPSFDTSGDYLYFLSYRDFTVKMDIYEDNHIISHPVKVMAVQLRAGEKLPFEDTAAKEEPAKEKEFRIDIEGIQDRIFPLPAASGNYFYLKGGKGVLTWASIPGYDRGEYEEVFTPSGAVKWTLHLFDMEKKNEVALEEKISDWRISTNGEHLLCRKGDTFFVSTLKKVLQSKSPGNALNLERMTYEVKVREEWVQIFSDTWRWYRDFFYDPGMHGRDWKVLGEKYRALLPDVNSRQELNWLLLQMVGDLCVSHTYIGGGDYGPRPSVSTPLYTGLLAADFEADPSGFYRFKTIYGPTQYNRDLKSPLVRPDMDCKEGYYLIAINGQPIRPPENIHKHLQVTQGKKVKITVNSNPSPEGAKTYEIEPIRSDWNLRYERWIADNIQIVLEKSDNEAGYIHLTAMGANNIGQFDKYWRAFRYKKGIIIDVRGNGGGWTEYFMIDKLERKMVAFNCLHEMEPFRYPGSVCNGKYVVVTNEFNGSDGEAFVEHFKARKLGTVIGVPSWGGLVGIINGQKTMDNGTVHQSNNAFYGREGEWLVENHGADPHLFVDNDPASLMAGKDLQLETAVEVILKQIGEDPFTFPPKPAYPKK